VCVCVRKEKKKQKNKRRRVTSRIMDRLHTGRNRKIERSKYQ
jgi:hypothetical protein